MLFTRDIIKYKDANNLQIKGWESYVTKALLEIKYSGEMAVFQHMFYAN